MGILEKVLKRCSAFLERMSKRLEKNTQFKLDDIHVFNMSFSDDGSAV